MKIFTEEEFLDWVFAADPDTPIDMGSSEITDCTPCLLGAFFLSKGYTKGFVTMDGILFEDEITCEEIAKVELSVSDIFQYFDEERISFVEKHDRLWESLRGRQIAMREQFKRNR